MGRASVIAKWRTPARGIGILLALVLGISVVACAPGAPRAGESQPDRGTQTAAPATAAKDLGKVRLASSGASISQFTALLAISEGFFEEEGLQVEFVGMSAQPDATAAVLSGSAEFSAGEAPQILRLVEVEEQPIKGIAVTSIGDGLYLAISKEWADSHGLAEDSSVDEKLSSMKGAKIAISKPGSSGTVRTVAIIKNRGVKDEELTLIPTGGGAPQFAAFESGQVDAFATSPPFPQQAEKDLGALIVNYEDVPELAGQIGSMHFTTEKMIDDKPEVVQAYVNGLARGFKYLRENRDEALEKARQTLPDMVDSDTMELSFNAFYEFLTAGLNPSEAAWKNSIDVYNLVSPPEDQLPVVPLTTVYDPTFVDKAKQALNITD